MSSLKKTTTTEYIQLQLILTNLSLMRSKLQNNGKNNANGLILNGGLFDSIYSLDFINKCKVLYLNPIHLKFTHFSNLPDLVRVQQIHSSCAFIEAIFEGEAAMPGHHYRL